MSRFTVRDYGKDSSGRTIWMTEFMHDWYEARCEAVGFRPTIVQGAFMVRDGGGAADSAGYHDQAGCLDVRTWDLTASQLNAWIRECREHAGAAWRRDKTSQHGGMDPHCHITLGADRPLSAGAKESWNSYLRGDNGLANNAPDYEWRPTPLVVRPPKEDDMPAYSEWSAKDKAALTSDVAKAVLASPVNALAKGGEKAFEGMTVRDLLKKVAKETGAVK